MTIFFFTILSEFSLVVVKELSICCYSDVQRVSQSTHVPGEFAGLANEWLDNGEGCVRWKEDLGATVQSPNNILK